MNSLNAIILSVEGSVNKVYSAFGLGEYQDLVLTLGGVGLLQKVEQLGQLLTAVAHLDDLLDVVVGMQLRRANVNVNVVLLPEEVPGQVANLTNGRCIFTRRDC